MSMKRVFTYSLKLLCILQFDDDDDDDDDDEEEEEEEEEEEDEDEAIFFIVLRNQRIRGIRELHEML